MHNFETGFEMGYEDEYGLGESEYGYEGEGEFYGEMSGESLFSEAEEMELAAELLNVSNEQELDQFLGGLFKTATRALGTAGRAIGNFARSPAGRQIGGLVKNAAKSALPRLGQMGGMALGNLIAPGVGGAIGGQLGSQIAPAIGSMFGLELEGLSQEDQEFEIARQIVRFGGAALSNAAEAPPNTPPQQAARQAAIAAAQQYAPGLLNPNAGGQQQGKGGCNHASSGQWIRKGNKIVLYGV